MHRARGVAGPSSRWVKVKPFHCQSVAEWRIEPASVGPNLYGRRFLIDGATSQTPGSRVTTSKVSVIGLESRCRSTKSSLQ